MTATLHHAQQDYKPLVARGAVAPDATVPEDGAVNLARIRQSKKLSQRDLADMIGMDAATVQRAETMHPSAKLATYKLCAEALGVPLEALFTDESLTPEETAALQLYRRIPPDRRGMVLDLFRLAQTPPSQEG